MGWMSKLPVGVVLALTACTPAAPPPEARVQVAPGLVALPCDGVLKAHWRFYCSSRRNYVTTAADRSLRQVAAALAGRYPGTRVAYMEASWPHGTRPMPPHRSHGDGRQIDLALFYTDREGRPLAGPPSVTGYGAFEPPRREADRRCTGPDRRSKLNDRADPPADRQWRLDTVRTRELVRLLSADPQVRRIFIEPHLKARLGFSADPKVRFAGCRAARHDDHIHVDFFQSASFLTTD
jgi:hypothetical protein